MHELPVMHELSSMPVAGAGPMATAVAVVLAAGESRRMGQPKMLLPWGGATVLEAVIRTLLAAPVSKVAVVLGHRADAHRAALGSLADAPRVIVVDNPRYREGMLTSVQAGVAALLQAERGAAHVGASTPEQPAAALGQPGEAQPQGGTSSPNAGKAPPELTGTALPQAGTSSPPSGGVLIALGDQPLITPGTVAGILAGHGGGITVPTFAGRRGHPICVDRSLLGPLLALPADEGLRGLFTRYPEAVAEVPVPTDEVLLDVDTPDAYRRALTLLAQRKRGA